MLSADQIPGPDPNHVERVLRERAELLDEIRRSRIRQEMLRARLDELEKTRMPPYQRPEWPNWGYVLHIVPAYVVPLFIGLALFVAGACAYTFPFWVAAFGAGIVFAGVAVGVWRRGGRAVLRHVLPQRLHMH